MAYIFCIISSLFTVANDSFHLKIFTMLWKAIMSKEIDQMAGWVNKVVAILSYIVNKTDNLVGQIKQNWAYFMFLGFSFHWIELLGLPKQTLFLEKILI